MNLVLMSYQCIKGFSSEDIYIVIIMIIPKLLLLLPLILLGEAQNDSQRSWSNRLPLRRPVITPGFRPESTILPTTNTPITTKQIPELVTQQYVTTLSEKYEDFTSKGSESAYVPVLASDAKAPNKGKVGFTIIFSNTFTENPISSSSVSPPPSNQIRPILRPSWPRPISKPENSIPLTSTVSPSTLIVTPPTSPVAPSTSTAAPSISIAALTTSTDAPSISTDAPSTLSVVDGEVAPKIPPANQEPEDRKPGFTIIFTDNYTKKPTTGNSSPVSVVAPSPSTTTSTVTEVGVAAKIPPTNQEPEDRKPGFTIIFSDNYTKKPTTINSSPSSVTGQPVQNPIQMKPTTFAPTSTVNQNTVSFTPTQATNLTPEKPTESYSILIIKNKDSDSNDILQQIANPPKKPADSTAAPSTTNIPVITLTSPVTNEFVTTTRPTIYTSTTSRLTTSEPTTSRPTPVRPIPSRPIPSRPIPSRPTTTSQLIVSKAPTPVSSRPVTTPAWRTTTTPITTSTTTLKPPTTWKTSTALNPQTTWKPTTQSVSQQRPPQTNVINQLYDYICKDVNGYYSVENKCDEFVLCKNNTAYKSTCPDGLHFDPVARWPAYPCAYPTEVKCQSPSVKQPAQPSGECPHRFGHFLIPNGDCGHFMMCQEGLATIMACPPGLAFNEKISACDWSVNVPGCNPSVFEGFTCPAMKSDTYGNSVISNYGYKNSCKNYIACHEGHPRLLSCDVGMSFDAATAKCVDSSLVKNCKS
ncbi:unnamed protein product [Euphydryas editha]|uniref:Chitin-binding type-2 domain-containing protein n=1 Tax=Euphydryas editha TaxID=104508 RepID=A0AAU9UQ57_EUPED|nr:unnamed protein product [Euphydryas editha]